MSDVSFVFNSHPILDFFGNGQATLLAELIYLFIAEGVSVLLVVLRSHLPRKVKFVLCEPWDTL
jgi:hypothetical protein